MKPVPMTLSAALVASHAAALVAADAGGAWVQLIPAGTFSGRDGRGPYIAGDRTAMTGIVEATRKIAGSAELVIDYDHQSVFAAVPGVGGRAPAAGWIKQLEVREDGIWGRVEWTETAAAAIRAGEYRYLSPVFHHDKTGRIRVISMAGLTNTPNLDLIPVAASALFTATSAEGDPMDKILNALGLAAGTNEDGVVAAINALLTSSTAIARAAGLTDTAKPDEIVAAVQSARQASTPDPTKFVPIAQVTQLQADLGKLQKEMAGDRAEEAVNKAIAGGKLVPALKEWGLSLHAADPAAFGKFVDAAPTLSGSQLKQPKRDANTPAPLGETEAAVCSALGLSPELYRKTLAAEAALEEAR